MSAGTEPAAEKRGQMTIKQFDEKQTKLQVSNALRSLALRRTNPVVGAIGASVQPEAARPVQTPLMRAVEALRRKSEPSAEQKTSPLLAGVERLKQKHQEASQ